MRLLRIRLKNYRGVKESDIQLNPQGITIIEGPNEIGKTSLREAIDKIFHFFDSSQAQEIRSIKPVHEDAGPEIEIEALSGPYAFTYSKRFLKKPETKLVITSPKPENYTGREAHERAHELLKETIDQGLWKALCIEQGSALSQADLSNQFSLSMALDKAAGGESADSGAGNLFERVQKEYTRYYTEKRSQEKQELKEARRRKDNLETEVIELEEQLQDLEKDAERTKQLSAELKGLEAEKAGLAKKVREYEEKLSEIQELERSIEKVQLRCDSAAQAQALAKTGRDERLKLQSKYQEQKEHHVQFVESNSSSQEAAKVAAEKLEQAQKAQKHTQEQLEKAEELLKVRRADRDCSVNESQLEELKERKARIDQARHHGKQAQALLKQNQVTQDLLQSIEDAWSSLAAAQAGLESGVSNLQIKALKALTLQIADEDESLEKDEIRSLSISEQTRLKIPDLIEIEVSASSNAEASALKVRHAQEKFHVACKRGGVSNLREAKEACEKRLEASRIIHDQERIEKDNLRNLTYQELEEGVARLEQSISEYRDNRKSDDDFAFDLAVAEGKLEEAEQELERVKSGFNEVREALGELQSRRDELRAQAQSAAVQIEMQVKALLELEAALKQARSEMPDQSLEQILAARKQEHKELEEELKATQIALKKKDPVGVKVELEEAQASLEAARRGYERAEKEDIEVRERLKLRGEDGLYEKLEEAQAQLEQANQSYHSLMKRASAAKLLYETMQEERDRSRQAYNDPLKEKIENLGRMVFNDSLSIELGEDLQIISRSLNGRTVFFHDLSGGAQEQLALITRLACAIAVSEDGGAPLILDDILGYTDPKRLQAMARVLTEAGRQSQIIILTCIPERYQGIEDARLVSIEPS